MKTRPIGRILAKRLLREKKASGSWRALQADKYPDIPAGTLSRIATTLGEYLPKNLKYREALGIGSAPCPTCHRKITRPRVIRTYRHLTDLSPSELRYVLEHREVMA